VERVGWVPSKPVKEIFPEIKKKAKTVYVVHQRKPPVTPYSMNLTGMLSSVSTSAIKDSGKTDLMKIRFI